MLKLGTVIKWFDGNEWQTAPVEAVMDLPSSGVIYTVHDRYGRFCQVPADEVVVVQ